MNSEITTIKKILEKEVKPMLAMHLGSLDFVGFEGGVVSIRLQGTCKGCPLSQLTLKTGIEEILKSKVSGVKKVRVNYRNGKMELFYDSQTIPDKTIENEVTEKRKI